MVTIINFERAGNRVLLFSMTFLTMNTMWVVPKLKSKVFISGPSDNSVLLLTGLLHIYLYSLNSEVFKSFCINKFFFFFFVHFSGKNSGDSGLEDDYLLSNPYHLVFNT